MHDSTTVFRLNVNPDIFAKVSSDPSCGKIHRVTTKNWRQHLMTTSIYLLYIIDIQKNSLRLFLTQGTPSKHFVFASASSSSSCDGRTKPFRIMFFIKDFHDHPSSVVVNFISRQFFGWYKIPLLSKFLVAPPLFFIINLFLISLPKG